MAPEIVIVLTAVLVAVPSALVGSFLVLRKMAMIGDAISHAVLPGIVIAFFLAGGPAPIPVLIGAASLGLLTVTLVEALYRSRLVKEDAAIGLVFPALFALGVYLVSAYGGRVHIDTQHVLYGEIAYAPWDILTVGDLVLGPKSLWVLGTVTVLILGFVLIFYKELKLASFDPGLATSLGFSPVLVHYLLMSAVSMTTVAAFDSVGAILVVALLIVPPATAYLLTDRLSVMLGLAVGAGALSAILGYLLARSLDGSIAGAMATVAGLLFGLAAVASPRYGFLAWLVRQARLRREFAADLLIAHLGQREIRDDNSVTVVAAPTPHHFATSITDLQARFRWSDRFTRSVLRQVTASGLVRSAGTGPGGDVNRESSGTADPTRVVLTDLGRTRATELIAQ
jgi:manganese/zinc/iron transport system permease protein